MENSKKMSVTQLIIITAVNMMGSGIIMLPTKLAEACSGRRPLHCILAGYCSRFYASGLCIR